jgi:hypothetical protein
LWIAGYATYVDTFGFSRSSTFCHYYEPTKFEMASCPTNNSCR